MPSIGVGDLGVFGSTLFRPSTGVFYLRKAPQNPTKTCQNLGFGPSTSVTGQPKVEVLSLLHFDFSEKTETSPTLPTAPIFGCGARKLY